MDLIDINERLEHSHIFLVRVWPGGDPAGLDAAQAVQGRWHGKVQPVIGGRGRCFEDWPTLVALLVAMLEDEEERET